jgi:hypothetical protein
MFSNSEGLAGHFSDFTKFRSGTNCPLFHTTAGDKKVEGKVHPRTGIEGSEREQRYSCALCLPHCCW